MVCRANGKADVTCGTVQFMPLGDLLDMDIGADNLIRLLTQW